MLKALKLVDMLYSATAIRCPIVAFDRKIQDLRTLACETMTISLPSFRTTFLPKELYGGGGNHSTFGDETSASCDASFVRWSSSITMFSCDAAFVCSSSYARRHMLVVMLVVIYSSSYARRHILVVICSPLTHAAPPSPICVDSPSRSQSWDELIHNLRIHGPALSDSYTLRDRKKKS